jgi:uncharacterized membrane protein YkoI
MRIRPILMALLVAPLLLPPQGIALAGERAGVDDDDDGDHDLAQELVEEGEIRPLRDIVAQATREHPGEVVGVALTRQQGGGWVYRLTLLTPEGRLLRLAIDARTMEPRDRREGEGD